MTQKYSVWDLISLGNSLKEPSSQALAAHACNPSYSGGRNQEDHGLGANRDPILKNPSQE
jgi:hypothetical protein